jgi:hypothetical protein
MSADGAGRAVKSVPPATRAVVEQFFDALFDGLPGVIEQRALPSKAQYFSPVAAPDAGRLAFLGTHWHENLYVGVATRRDHTAGTLENCVSLGALFADIDFKTTPEADAREALAVFPLPPTCIVHSGGGLHVYYGLREPLTLPGDEARARVLLKRLATYLGGDLAAAEPARVLRVPGTVNRKPDYQSPRPVTLELCAPDRRYNHHELEEWLPPLVDEPSSGRFQLPASPVGPGERHLLLFKLARSMKTRGLTSDAVLAALRIENQQRCAPPLPDAEVSRQVQSAFAQADRPGFTPVDPAATNGNGAPTDDGLGLVSLGTLLAEPREAHQWLVVGRLPIGGLGMIAGKPKAGKSTLARCLALAVARGTPWLGFDTTQGCVLYLALEEKRAEVREHFRDLGATDQDPVYILCAAAPIDGLARLRREVERRRPALIIVDPLFKFVRVPDSNDYATVTTALEPILTLARESGACVLIVHHLGKGEQRVGADAILGSTAIFGAVDTALLLRRGETYRTLETVQRYGEDLAEITLGLDPVTRTVTAGPPRAEAEQADAARDLLAHLAGLTTPVTEAELDGAIECRRQIWKRALRTLVAAGQITRTGRGARRTPSGMRRPGNQNARRRVRSRPRNGSGIQVPPIYPEPGNQNPCSLP